MDISLNKNKSEHFEFVNSNDIKEMKAAFKDSVLDNIPATINVWENFSNKKVQLAIVDLKESARGSFGIVCEATLDDSRIIAIKKIVHDPKYRLNELNLMKMIKHNNITTLLYFFYTNTKEKNQLYLNLVMDFIPQTLCRILKFYSKSKSYLPIDFTKVYIFQLFRGINYLHQMGICHRDIKPPNILLDPGKTLLRICDFGSAKLLISTDSNVAYICSRYYRAPELIFGSINYTMAIDIWSAGCVFAEVLLNKPLFPGESSVDQLVEVIKILGTPTKENVKDMNPNYSSYNLPLISPCPFNQIFTNADIPTEAFALLKATFEYSPHSRISAMKALVHAFFDDIRKPNFKLGSNRNCPSIFDFSDLELVNADQSTKIKLNGH